MPITLAGFGSYHAGGRRLTVTGAPVEPIRFTADTPPFPFDPNGEYRVEQAYGQWFEPVPRRPGAPPVVLLHGGGMTGAMWETTPDGRPGWLWQLLAAGFPVHVIDQVERGRAGFNATPEPWPGRPLTRTAQEAWSLFRIGPPAGYATRTPYPGSRFPVAGFDRLVAQFVPRWTATADAQAGALVAVLAEVDRRHGPAVLVCHSQGGAAVFRVLAARPDLLAGIVALEPSGFPDPPGLGTAAMDVPVAFVMGDFLDTDPLWSGLSRRVDEAVRRLAIRGLPAIRIDLPDLGYPGTTHMMMMEVGTDFLYEIRPFS